MFARHVSTDWSTLCLRHCAWRVAFNVLHLSAQVRRPMLILLIILLIVFGGGGGYYGYHQWGPGGGLGIVLLVLLVLFLFGRGRNSI
jgi:hypothetical protein